MRIIFVGTPNFATQHLQTLIDQRHEICGVITQIDRRKGRGQKLTPSAVKELALQHRLNIYQPIKWDQGFMDELYQLQQNWQAQVMIVVAYGLILPKVALTLTPYGTINVHASLLPKWRGAAPIQRAIETGDQKTGITIMQMDSQLDHGDILCQSDCPIDHDDTTITLHDKLATIGAKILAQTLAKIDTITPLPQDHQKASYAHKIQKSEAKINWYQSATVIHQKVRALQPWPVAYTELKTQTIRILQTQVIKEIVKELPGTIINSQGKEIIVACQKDYLALQRLQLPGGKVLPSYDLLNAHRNLFQVGLQFN